MATAQTKILTTSIEQVNTYLGSSFEYQKYAGKALLKMLEQHRKKIVELDAESQYNLFHSLSNQRKQDWTRKLVKQFADSDSTSISSAEDQKEEQKNDAQPPKGDSEAVKKDVEKIAKLLDLLKNPQLKPSTVQSYQSTLKVLCEKTGVENTHKDLLTEEQHQQIYDDQQLAKEKKLVLNCLLSQIKQFIQKIYTSQTKEDLFIFIAIHTGFRLQEVLSTISIEQVIDYQTIKVKGIEKKENKDITFTKKVLYGQALNVQTKLAKLRSIESEIDEETMDIKLQAMNVETHHHLRYLYAELLSQQCGILDKNKSDFYKKVLFHSSLESTMHYRNISVIDDLKSQQLIDDVMKQNADMQNKSIQLDCQLREQQEKTKLSTEKCQQLEQQIAELHKQHKIQIDAHSSTIKQLEDQAEQTKKANSDAMQQKDQAIENLKLEIQQHLQKEQQMQQIITELQQRPDVLSDSQQNQKYESIKAIVLGFKSASKLKDQVLQIINQ